MVRLLIADDHQVILDGFEAMLNNIDTISLIGTVKNGQDVLEFIRSHEVDVIMLDINMPVLNGVEACKLITKNHPKIKVIALSMFTKASYVKRMKQSGAKGYLLKNDSIKEVTKAIMIVNEGGEYYSSALKEIFLDSMFKKNQDILFHLTERESEVLKYISEGCSNKEIGEKINLSVHTINSYRKQILSKFNARNTADLIKKAIDKGML